MQVLLLKDVRKLGHLGDVVEVRPGYARNYLYPQGLAALPTEENIQAIEQDKKRAALERAARLTEYQRLADQMKDLSVTIEANANPEGTLYGSVGPREVSQALRELGYPVEPDMVVLAAPIRTLDNRPISIAFTDEISTQIKLWVVRAGAIEHAEASASAADDIDRPQPAEEDEL